MYLLILSQGELVYVNYGLISDFQMLRNDLNVNVSGKVCIARYGISFRAYKGKLLTRKRKLKIDTKWN